MTTAEMTQMKYIRYSDLRAYLAVLLAESRQRAAATRQTPVRCAEDNVPPSMRQVCPMP